MADIISQDRRRQRRVTDIGSSVRPTGTTDGAVGSVGATDIQQSLLALVELLFFAYRDFTGEADAALAAYGLGRAHHRVIHFVNRCPGIRVAALLELLKITKQSLGRVLRKLLADQWLEQAPGPEDRRERLLTLTPAGRELAVKLAALQTVRIDRALQEITASNGCEARDHVHKFLLAMIAREERAAVAAIVNPGSVMQPRTEEAGENRGRQ